MRTIENAPANRRGEPDITADGYRLARLPEVMKAVGLSRSMVYYLMARGEFPASIKLGSRAVAWKVADVATWIDRRASGVRPEREGGRNAH